jgi:hypothetical protein
MKARPDMSGRRVHFRMDGLFLALDRLPTVLSKCRSAGGTVLALRGTGSMGSGVANKWLIA